MTGRRTAQAPPHRRTRRRPEDSINKLMRNLAAYHPTWGLYHRQLTDLLGLYTASVHHWTNEQKTALIRSLMSLQSLLHQGALNEDRARNKLRDVEDFCNSANAANGTPAAQASHQYTVLNEHTTPADHQEHQQYPAHAELSDDDEDEAHALAHRDPYRRLHHRQALIYGQRYALGGL